MDEPTRSRAPGFEKLQRELLTMVEAIGDYVRQRARLR
jgi:hypothetical protein